MLYYIDRNWYHFIKEYLEQISTRCSPSRVTKQTYFGKLTCRHTLIAQNHGASVRLQHWGNLMTASVFFIHFLLIFATQLIETRFFFYFGTCFITVFEGDKYEFCIWKTSLFNSLVVAAWDRTFYSRRHHMKISSVYCFNLYIYYSSLNKSKIKLDKIFTLRWFFKKGIIKY